MQKYNKIFIYRFNESLRTPCYLLNFHDVNILLDCPLDLSTLQNFLPKHPLLQTGASNLRDICTQPLEDHKQLCSVNNQILFDADFKFGFINKGKINNIYPETIDVILISNSQTMLGLPFITQHYNFKGKIFATEPTIQFARLMMMDILANLKSLPKCKNSLDVNSAEFLRLSSNSTFASLDLTTWYDMYTEEAVQSCISRIQRVNFNEPLNLFGLLEVQALCSGYSIGSSNWLISSRHEKISYISHSSGIVSHVLPLDTVSFKDVDILIVGTAVQIVVPPIEKFCDDLCGKICETIKAGGNVIVPINCCGLFFDIIEKLYVELGQQKLERTQMFILSSQAKPSLTYANIYGEWLNAQRESQLYTADYPFVFEKLIQLNVLIPCDDINGIFSEKYRTPSIVFASHPSLRMGPVVHLLRLWGSNPLNGLFLIDTANYSIIQKRDRFFHNIDRSVAPFHPLKMAVHYYPMEIGIKVSELSALVEQMSLPTKALVLPAECMDNQALMKISENIKKFELRSNKFIQIILPDDNSISEDILLAQSLYDHLKPIVVDENISLALINAKIVQRDGQSELQSTSSTGPAKTRFLFGSLDPNQFIEELKLKGLVDAKLDVLEDGKRYLVYFTEEDSLIQLNENSTHVVCENEEMRKKIQEALVACFSVLSL